MWSHLSTIALIIGVCPMFQVLKSWKLCTQVETLPKYSVTWRERYFNLTTFDRQIYAADGSGGVKVSLSLLRDRGNWLAQRLDIAESCFPAFGGRWSSDSSDGKKMPRSSNNNGKSDWTQKKNHTRGPVPNIPKMLQYLIAAVHVKWFRLPQQKIWNKTHFQNKFKLNSFIFIIQHEAVI